MTRTEITLNSYSRELEKLYTRRERVNKSYEKKLEIAKKFEVESWTIAQHNEWLATIETAETGFIINKADIKKNEAWFNLYCAKRELEDVIKDIEKKTSLFNKYSRIYQTELEQVEQDEITNQRAQTADKYLSARMSEEEIKAMREQMKAEWLKDGIEIKEFYGNSIEGNTPKGKHFSFTINNGFTERSNHCYTLYIKGLGMIFTSGTVLSCYKAIKRN